MTQALCIVSILAATATAPSSAEKRLEQQLAAFRSARVMNATFVQTTRNPSLGTERVRHGQFAFRRPSSFYWEFTDVPARLTVVNGKTLWVLERDSTGKAVKLRRDKNFDLSASRLAWFVFFGKSTPSREFKSISTGEAPESFRMVPKSISDGVTEMALTFSKDKTGVLQFVSWKDETGASTELHFTQPTLLSEAALKSLPADKKEQQLRFFNWSPPKDLPVEEVQP